MISIVTAIDTDNALRILGLTDEIAKEINLMKHGWLHDEAKEAINKLFIDSSVPNERVYASLVALRTHAEDAIEATEVLMEGFAGSVTHAGELK